MIKIILLFIYIFLLYACYTDITARIIKNKTVIIVAILSIIIGVIKYNIPEIALPLFILFIGTILSSLGFFGAGDIKLIFALSLSLSNSLIISFILMTAISGLIVVIPIIITSIYRKKKITVPYGIAISLGYLFITVPML
ncbi:prepilin peptidase [Budviciaceae bacterium BWR-B9]|uniref:Prepilin peptidase n=1 Tax=Limnobaculum allomyrinae TaxID=2791986 RepID=A0ABS1IP42_9GAMM|nr:MULTISPECIES: prepilin peptidase [Limnobaculum]MBK5143523.1 prepilin peptidase [Limnobaculum allomyrinae]MBV7691411.1 prepilin peptidase [Limnobaculum sp. M2-1]